MGKSRFMHTNMITAASMLAPSSNAVGVLSNAQKEGSGSGSLQTAGDHTAASELIYLVVIDLAGEVGVATFKWSDDDGAAFDATGVLTSTSAVALNNGISAIFAGGTGADFVLADLWRFRALLPHGKAKLIDLDPDTEWRSASSIASAINVVVDFASAKAPDALVVHKHNFSSGATIRLQADDASDFSSLGVDEAVSWATGSIIHYPSTTPRSFRYWRLRVTDAANADGYLRIAGLFLGGYTEPVRSVALGHRRSRQRLADRRQMLSGRWSGGLNAVAEVFELNWTRLAAAERTALLDVYNSLLDEALRTVSPCYFHLDSAAPTVTRNGVTYGDVYLCEWDGQGEVEQESDSGATYVVPARLVEVPRTL